MITYSNAYYKMLPIESEFVDFEIGYFKNNLRDLRYKFIKLFNKNLQLILFVSSSLVSFLFDYFGFVALFFLLSSVNISNKIILANIISRIFSASINFLINNKVVFKNKNIKLKQVFTYFMLACSTLAVNSLILTTLIYLNFDNIYLLKLSVEFIIFFLNWIIQKHIIFRKPKNI